MGKVSGLWGRKTSSTTSTSRQSSSCLALLPASPHVLLTLAAHLSEPPCVSLGVAHNLLSSSLCVTGAWCRADRYWWAPGPGSPLPSLCKKRRPYPAHCLGLASASPTDKHLVGLLAQKQLPSGDGHVPSLCQAQLLWSSQTSRNQQLLPAK